LSDYDCDHCGVKGIRVFPERYVDPNYDVFDFGRAIKDV
jgi:hypothetical protein